MEGGHSWCSNCAYCVVAVAVFVFLYCLENLWRDLNLDGHAQGFCAHVQTQRKRDCFITAQTEERSGFCHTCLSAPPALQYFKAHLLHHVASARKLQYPPLKHKPFVSLHKITPNSLLSVEIQTMRRSLGLLEKIFSYRWSVESGSKRGPHFTDRWASAASHPPSCSPIADAVEDTEPTALYALPHSFPLYFLTFFF